MVLHLHRKIIIIFAIILLLAGTLPGASFAIEKDGVSQSESGSTSVETSTDDSEGNDPGEAESSTKESTSADSGTNTDSTNADTSVKQETSENDSIAVDVSITGMDLETEEKEKWLEKESIKIAKDSNVLELLKALSDDLQGKYLLTAGGTIQSMSAPQGSAFAGNTLEVTTHLWYVYKNNVKIEYETPLKEIGLQASDSIEFRFEESSADELGSLSSDDDSALKAFASNESIAFDFGNTKDKLLKEGDDGAWSYDYCWSVIGNARAGYMTDAQKNAYYNGVVAKLQSVASSTISRSQSSENSRTIIALTAIGQDVTNVGTGNYNLLEPLADMTYLTMQGMNGPLWALIAFDSGNYSIPTVKSGGNQVSREKLINYMLNAQHSDGGWAYSGSSDIDITAMTIQALAPYYNSSGKISTSLKSSVDTAVNKALSWLSQKQNADGAFTTGTVSSESQSQVIVALTSIGLDPATDTRFLKNGKSAMDSLLSFYVAGGGFKHVDENWKSNGLATMQANYALVSYYRYRNGKNSLYQMSDNKDGYVIDVDYVADTTKPAVPNTGDGNKEDTKSSNTASAKGVTKSAGLIKASGKNSKEANDALKLIKAVNASATVEKSSTYSDEEYKKIAEAYSRYEALKPAEKLAIEKDKAWKEFKKIIESLGRSNHYESNRGVDMRDNAEEILPWYVKIETLDRGLKPKQKSKIREVLGDDSKLFASYDIKLVNTLDNSEWKPENVITVKLRLPDEATMTKALVVHIGKNGRIEFIDGKVNGTSREIEFRAAEFSVYAIAGSENEVKDILGARHVNVLPWCLGAIAALMAAMGIVLIKRKSRNE